MRWTRIWQDKPVLKAVSIVVVYCINQIIPAAPWAYRQTTEFILKKGPSNSVRTITGCFNTPFVNTYLGTLSLLMFIKVQTIGEMINKCNDNFKNYQDNKFFV